MEPGRNGGAQFRLATNKYRAAWQTKLEANIYGKPMEGWQRHGALFIYGRHVLVRLLVHRDARTNEALRAASAPAESRRGARRSAAAGRRPAASLECLDHVVGRVRAPLPRLCLCLARAAARDCCRGAALGADAGGLTSGLVVQARRKRESCVVGPAALIEGQVPRQCPRRALCAKSTGYSPRTNSCRDASAPALVLRDSLGVRQCPLFQAGVGGQKRGPGGWGPFIFPSRRNTEPHTVAARGARAERRASDTQESSAAARCVSCPRAAARRRRRRRRRYSRRTIDTGSRRAALKCVNREAYYNRAHYYPASRCARRRLSWTALQLAPLFLPPIFP